MRDDQESYLRCMKLLIGVHGVEKNPVTLHNVGRGAGSIRRGQCLLVCSNILCNASMLGNATYKMRNDYALR